MAEETVSVGGRWEPAVRGHKGLIVGFGLLSLGGFIVGVLEVGNKGGAVQEQHGMREMSVSRRDDGVH